MDLKNEIINKSGFLIYTDYWEKYFSKMSGEQIKEVFKIIFCFNKTFEILKTDDLAVEMVVATIIDNIKRDAEKRFKQSIASKENGKMGGRPKLKKNKPIGSNPLNPKPNLDEAIIKKEIDIPKFIDKNLFVAFIEMRIKIKKPLTEVATDLLIKKLTKFESKQVGLANQALENSIESSYQGVFEPKINNSTQKPTGMPKPRYDDPDYYKNDGGWND
jgi:hypothetical protein